MNLPGRLNIRLSLLLLVFGGLLIAVNHWRNQTWLLERRVKRVEQDAYSKGSRLSGIMQHLFRKPGTRRAAELELSYASVAPELELGLICDGTDKVVYASQLRWRSAQICDTPVKDMAEVIKTVRETSIGQVHHDGPKGRMTAVFPFYEGYDAHRTGVVLLRYNPALVLAQTGEDALYESAAQGCVLGAICLLLWLALDVMVTQKVGRILKFSDALADGGKPLPPAIEGHDELAVISQGFAQAVAKLRGIELRLLEASEQERRRIGRDLHDDVCQRIAAAQLKSGVLGAALDRDASPHMALAKEVAQELARAAQVARGFARGLAPVWIEQGALAPAIADLGEALSHSFSIKCQADCDLGGNILAVWVETHVYRIVQELSANAAKHAHPTYVQIRVDATPTMLTAEVENDGESFDGTFTGSGGLGMQFLQQRVRALGGSLQYFPDRGTSPGRGTLARCQVPLTDVHRLKVEPPPP